MLFGLGVIGGLPSLGLPGFGLPGINLPNIDLPDIDGPDINLPNINGPSIGDLDIRTPMLIDGIEYPRDSITVTQSVINSTESETPHEDLSSNTDFQLPPTTTPTVQPNTVKPHVVTPTVVPVNTHPQPMSVKP